MRGRALAPPRVRSRAPAGVSATCAPAAALSSSTAVAGSFARLHLKPQQARRRLGPRMAVDVDVADLPGSQKKLTIKVSGDECTNAYESVLAKLVRGAEIPGFRKGKAPPQMVLNHFGKKSISAEACESIIGAAVPLALQQNDIRAIGQVPLRLNSSLHPRALYIRVRVCVDVHLNTHALLSGLV